MMRVNTLLAAVCAVGLPAAALADVSGNVVRIGVLNDQSGAYSEITGRYSVAAAEMAVEDFGPLPNGVTVEVISADHQNKPDVASNVARGWYEQRGVDVIVDVNFSSVALAVQTIAKERSAMVIHASAMIERLVQQDCTPTSVHFYGDSYSATNVTGKAAVAMGGKKWFFMTADYVAGQATADAIKDVVLSAGGEIVGEVKHPTNITDFSSYLLQAQSSGADVVLTTAAGNDTVNLVKQWNEFGLTHTGQRLAAAYVFLSDIHSIGLQNSQGMLLAQSFYWDADDQSREWAKRYTDKVGRVPADTQAALYSGVTHYLKAVAALGTDDAVAVSDWMRANPVDDFYGRGARILPNGRLLKEMYLTEVKKPEESTGAWDYLKVVNTVSADAAFRPIEQTKCTALAD